MKKESYIAFCLPGRPRRQELRELVRRRCPGWGAVEIELYPGTEEYLVLIHPAGESVFLAAGAAALLAERFGQNRPGEY